MKKIFLLIFLFFLFLINKTESMELDNQGRLSSFLSTLSSSVDAIKNISANHGHKVWFTVSFFLFLRGIIKLVEKETDKSKNWILGRAINKIGICEEFTSKITKNKFLGSTLIGASFMPLLLGYLHKIAYK